MELRRYRALLARYLEIFPEEEGELRRLAAFLEGSRDTAEAISRKTPAGHLTASGMLVLRSDRRALLIKHVTLGKYLQPGGHIEPDDATPVEAAMREVREETPVSELELLPIDSDAVVPLDIDCHVIPPNPRKDEGEHTHFDLRYLFVTHESPEPPPDGSFALHELSGLQGAGDLGRLALKAQRLLAHLLPCNEPTPEKAGKQ